MNETNGIGIVATVKEMYVDFVKFTFGRVVMPNLFARIGMAGLTLAALFLFIRFIIAKRLYKKPLFYVFTLLFVAVIPPVMNAILLISTDVTYHVLMRYQWAFMIVIPIAVIYRLTTLIPFTGKAVTFDFNVFAGWLSLVLVIFVSLSYIVTDNIAYSNLNKKYEKTYAYCLRVADRIEETEGYYPGIPIALVGVVGEDSFPLTDITKDVTGSLLGVWGDYLIYKPENYRDFYKHYLGITFNILGEDDVTKFYDEDFYAEMESFPGATSVKLHDGVIYVKTENIR